MKLAVAITSNRGGLVEDVQVTGPMTGEYAGVPGTNVVPVVSCPENGTMTALPAICSVSTVALEM